MINYDNPKLLKAWLKPDQPGPLSPQRNIHCSKVMLCIWWDQKGIVYYELLQPGTTINAQFYKKILTQLSLELQHKRPEYAKRHEKIIFQHDNTKPHVAKLAKKTLETIDIKIGLITGLLQKQHNFSKVESISFQKNGRRLLLSREIILKKIFLTKIYFFKFYFK